MVLSLLSSDCWQLIPQKSLSTWTSFSLKTREGKVAVDSGKRLTPRPYQSQQRLRTIRTVTPCGQASYIPITHIVWFIIFICPKLLLSVNIQYDCLDTTATMDIAHRENSTSGTGEKLYWWNYSQLTNTRIKLESEQREEKASDFIPGLRDGFGLPWWCSQKLSRNICCWKIRPCSVHAFCWQGMLKPWTESWNRAWLSSFLPVKIKMKGVCFCPQYIMQTYSREQEDPDMSLGQIKW